MDKKRITIKDIAKKTGLSVSTVSLAMSGKGRINTVTRQRVLQEARNMGYQPNVIGSTLSKKEKYRIGVICPEDDIYFGMVLQSIQEYYKEIAQFKIELRYFLCKGYGEEDQIQKLIKCMKSGVDGILINPVSTERVCEYVDRLAERNIIVVTFTNDIPGKRKCFVGQNGILAGELAAELMERMLSENSRIALFNSAEKLTIMQQRVDYFKRHMQNSEKQFWFSKPYLFANDMDKSVQLAMKMIETERPDAIYVNNMLGTLAVGRAMEQLGLKKEILVFGYDANEEISQMMKKGYIDVTLFQDPFAQGYHAFKALFHMLYYRQQLQRSIYHTRTIVLTKSNVDEYDHTESIFYS